MPIYCAYEVNIYELDTSLALCRRPMGSTLRAATDAPTVGPRAGEARSQVSNRLAESKGPSSGEEKGPATTPSASPFSPPSHSLRLGDRIEARYREGREWMDGKIVSVNTDGTYDIRYTDGKEERRVRKELIRPAASGTGEEKSPG